MLLALYMACTSLIFTVAFLAAAPRLSQFRPQLQPTSGIPEPLAAGAKRLTMKASGRSGQPTCEKSTGIDLRRILQCQLHLHHLAVYEKALSFLLMLQPSMCLFERNANLYCHLVKELLKGNQLHVALLNS